MSSMYISELHKFIEEYFNAIGAQIQEKQDDFFLVSFPDGKKERYTYLARIAGENKEIKLLAKGSKALMSIIKECSSRSSLSELQISYSESSLRKALKPKDCCDLCPFTTVCSNIDFCCNFCPSFKDCNTFIRNAEFSRLGIIKESKPADVIIFTFTVTLSNDYSLSQKIDKIINVLIDMNTFEITDNILTRNMLELDMKPAEESFSPRLKENYHKYLKLARNEAENKIKNHMEVFKKEIETPLKDKISAITGKFEEEYIDNYTKSTLEQLDELQGEALKLCEREIRGYTINCDYILKNVMLVHTNVDQAEIIFRLNESEAEIPVPAEIFLNRVNIKCSECGSEVAAGTICDKGHVLCRNCSHACSTCGKAICSICDDESIICSTCGEETCSECAIKCSSCDAVLCSDHAYTCSICGKVSCIDCYDICTTCSINICKEHTHNCSECKEPLCPEHTYKCSVCGESYCDSHIENCSVCGSMLCVNHLMKSAYSSRSICSSHAEKCSVCSNTFAADEIKSCSTCGTRLCPDHSKECSTCGKTYCTEHISRCLGCGKNVCSCTAFIKCKLCGEEYCSHCINGVGYCGACETLTAIDLQDDLIKHVLSELPAMQKYKKFYFGRSHDIAVVYARSLINNQLIVLDSSKKIITVREIGFFDHLKIKSKFTRKGR